MTGKTILITRGVSDGEELHEQLQELGHRVIHEPLTEIFLNHTVRQELQQSLQNEPDAIILTSRYGARALAALTEIRDLALLCVGDATAEAARSVGFTRVSTAGGTADDLVTYILDAYDSDSRLIYGSAVHVRTDLEAELGAYGMEVQRVVLYEATASEALSDTLIEQLKREQVDAVTFLSQRSVDIFLKLLANTDVSNATDHMEAYCLSEAVAMPLQDSQWKSIIIAPEPTLASLISTIDDEPS
ncbi:MAG: uroporphyrinogen-III synthase [Rickettsiales bacterium]